MQIFTCCLFYTQRFFSESQLISEPAVEEFHRRTSNLIAFVESVKTRNSSKDFPRVVLLAEFNGLEGSTDGRKIFELVEFSRGEITAIERFYQFDQSEFLRFFLASSNFQFNFFANLTNLAMFKRKLAASLETMDGCVWFEVRDNLSPVQ